MSSLVITLAEENGYYATAPDGRKLKLDKALFDALEIFVGTGKSGSVEAQFRNGGYAGVEIVQRLK